MDEGAGVRDAGQALAFALGNWAGHPAVEHEHAGDLFEVVAGLLQPLIPQV